MLYTLNSFQQSPPFLHVNQFRLMLLYDDVFFQILCLHGYRQDATKFRQQTGSLRKQLKSVAELEFTSAPFFVPSEGEASRSWWFTGPNGDSFSSRDSPGTCTGLDESLRAVEDAWKSNGPYDGLLGFSQGACLVGMLPGLIENKKTSLDPKFVVIVSGFKSKCKAHEFLYNTSSDLPSLHVFGETDEVIPVAWGQELAASFRNAIILQHQGGHFVPGNSVYRKDYHSFFEQLNV